MQLNLFEVLCSFFFLRSDANFPVFLISKGNLHSMDTPPKQLHYFPCESVMCYATNPGTFSDVATISLSVVTNSNSSSGFYCNNNKKSSLKLIVCQLLLYYTETWLSSNKNISLLVLQALKQQSQGAAHPPLLQFWKPDGPKCNCFNGGKGEGILKDWLRDLVSRWTNQRGSQGHSQGPRQTNIPVCPLSHPCTFALTNTSKTKTHRRSSHTSLCFQPAVVHTLPRGWNRSQAQPYKWKHIVY